MNELQPTYNFMSNKVVKELLVHYSFRVNNTSTD